MVPRAPGRAIAVVLAGITVALCAGIPAGTALAGVFGWRTSFALLAGLALLLVAWVRWKVPAFPGEPPARRAPLHRVASQRGIPVVLIVTFLLLTGHQAMYTYIAPLAGSRTGLALLVFGTATVGGIWITGLLADGQGAGVAALPWVTSAFAAAALALVAGRVRPGRSKVCSSPR
jgi:predicted MFS family arabinose efflux permease